MPRSAVAPAAPPSVDVALARHILELDLYHDPLTFVRWAWPWGVPGGPLEDYDGPDTWQTRVLEEIGRQVKARAFNGRDAVAPIRIAVSSGHGIGKSVLSAWLILWLMSTRPNCRGSVTANTFSQLSTKTWATLLKWHKMAVPGRWFTGTSSLLYRNGQRESWFCAAQSSKEENSEAFAGQHAADSSSFYVLDEASAIPEVIWDVAEGGLTDGEPLVVAFGNPTRSSGRFHSVCFGALRDRWTTFTIDSREARFTNKQQIAEWAADYGEDSDFFRVRVRGLPPRASDLQYIDQDRVSEAQTRDLVEPLEDEPLVAGLDVARGGEDSCVIRFRRGPDARSIPPIRVPGEQARDSMRLVTLAADVLERDYGQPGSPRKVAMLFVDATGVGGPIVDRLRQLGHKNVLEVQFGGKPPDAKMANMRAWMWAQMREWLARGCIDRDARLEADLVGPGYHHDRQDRLVLESKESMKARQLASPDDGDALALTFAAPVRGKERPKRPTTVRQPFRGRDHGHQGWMG